MARQKYSYPAGVGVKDGTKEGRTLAAREVLPKQPFRVGEAWMTLSVFDAMGAVGLAELEIYEFEEDAVPEFHTPGTRVDVLDGLIMRGTWPDAVLDEGAQIAAADAVILAQISELEALLTPRLRLEADCGEDCIVNKPGCCIHGLSPVAARAQINTEIKALRAQLTGEVYYHVE